MYKYLFLFFISFSVNAGGDSSGINPCSMPVTPVKICNASEENIVFEFRYGSKIPVSPEKCITLKKICNSEDVQNFLKEHRCHKIKIDTNIYNIKGCSKE